MFDGWRCPHVSGGTLCTPSFACQFQKDHLRETVSPANALEAGAYVLSGNESIRGILSQVGSVARTLISALGLLSSPEIQSLVEIAWDTNGPNLNAVAWLTCASSHKNHSDSPKAEVLFMVHNKFQQQLKMVSVSNQLPECYVG